VLLLLIFLNQQELLWVKIEVQRFVRCASVIFQDLPVDELLLRYLAIGEAISAVGIVVIIVRCRRPPRVKS
jgi:hypothetical protein